MTTSPRISALRALLLAAAVSPFGCGDDPAPTSSGTGSSGAAGVGASGGAAGAGASSGTSGQSGAGGNPGGCAPGTINACPCATSSGEGVQTCQPDGTFGSCEGCSGGEGGSDSAGGSGGSNAGKGGAAGKGGSGGKGGSAGKGGASGAGGKGGAGQGGTGGAAGQGGETCTLVPDEGSACGECVVAKCCPSATACFDDTACNACLDDISAAGCADNKLLAAFDDCTSAACQGECYEPACNPVTNEGCDKAKGEACDLGSDGLQCFEPPNEVALCGACSNADGPFCQGGLHCLAAQCTPFCETDADCKGKGVCDLDALGLGNYGLCVQEKGKGDDAVSACLTKTPAPYPCKDPKPQIIDGKDTGYATCADGRKVRLNVVVCPNPPYIPSQTACVASGGDCTKDSECTNGLDGRCTNHGDFCECQYLSNPCSQDSDCGAGSVCVCGPDGGQCSKAKCTTSADCAVGDCIQTFSCDGYIFTCQTAMDSCGSSADCQGNSNGPACLADTGTWHCTLPHPCEVPVPGRPLRVDSTPRQSALVRRSGAWA